MSGKWVQICLLSMACSLAMTLWFSGSAVIPQLTVEWSLDASQQSWITMSVQIGFVAGALLSAILNLGDRMPVRWLLAVSALLGATSNAVIPVLNPELEITLILRFLTGAALAGVYPPGMKLMATWCKEDRGLGIGLLVGSLTLGKAIPHLLNAFPLFGEAGMPPWRAVFLATSGMAGLAALVSVLFLRSGPYLSESAPFDWRFSFRSLRSTPTRLANFGYLGHMWELYAMWTWAPIFLIASFEAAGASTQAARLAGFATIAAGAAGSVFAGVAADRIGRTRVTIWSLAISGSCTLAVGFLFPLPLAATIVCLIWGFAVVADSAQFSAAVSELTDSRYVGTALTIQTCLGFLLTLASIRLIPYLMDLLGWQFSFMILAAGPVFGILSMRRLRQLPEATRMANGKR